MAILQHYFHAEFKASDDSMNEENLLFLFRDREKETEIKMLWTLYIHTYRWAILSIL